MILPTRLFQTRLSRFATATALLSGLWLGSQPPPAQAGCGCDKPPPELATVRPNATYAGMDVTLTHPSILNGQSYTVTFTSGTTGESASVTAVAVTQRDLADGQDKPQVVAGVPALPLGPTSISVSLAGQSGVVMTTTDETFTLAPQPIVFPETVGQVSLPDYQAAVSRSGVVYISLDVSDMHLPRTFHAQAGGYPLRFTNDEVVFYNTQGFLMQLLDEGMPGLFAIDAATGSSDSDTLQYSRHEFNTHFLQHAERQAHGVEASDPNWHLDGTPHIDHDHLIVAISGMLDDGSLPVPGATPRMNLSLSARSFFQHGIVGTQAVTMLGRSFSDSYNSRTGLSGEEGDVLSNGTVTLNYYAAVHGDATAAAFGLSTQAIVTGDMLVSPAPRTFLPVEIPTGLEDLGAVTLRETDTLTLGSGSYILSGLTLLFNSQLHIDNTDGPVTLYVAGPVRVRGNATITTSDPNPEKFAIYVAGNRTVEFKYQGTVYGTVYAPESTIEVLGRAQLSGALVGQAVLTTYDAQVHYDTALRGE